MKIHSFLSSAAAFSALMVFIACAGPEIKYSENKYGEENPESKRILVAYASRAGSTGEVADFIGKSLAGRGVVVEVKRITNIQDINRYQAIVIGSAVRKGRVLPEALDLVKRYKEKLNRIPVAYFLTCTALLKKTEESRKTAYAYLDPLCAVISPVGKGVFAGKMDYSKLGFANKIIIKYFVKIPEGDYRDWESIKKWIVALRPKLIQPKI